MLGRKGGTVAEHTTLPWAVGGPYPEITVCWLNGEDDPEVGNIGMEPICVVSTAAQTANAPIEVREIDEANAEFIVRACNNYEDLLTACKEALGYLDRGGIDRAEWYKITPQHVAKFRRVINKAEGRVG
jgi:hypothetical protein